MRIVLHAGFHKTGTTSLQVTLDAHRGALAGFAHFETPHGTPHLSRAAEAARGFCLTGDARALAQGMRDWVARLPPLEGRHLVVSSEDLVGHIPGRFGVTDYRAAVTTVPAAVAALAERFPGAEVVVFLTTRAAGPWLWSVHWQLALHPELMLKQRRFCKDFAPAADFDAVIAPLRAALQGRAVLHHASMESLLGKRLAFVDALYDLIALPDALRQGLVPTGAHKRRSVEGLADQFVMLNRAKLPPEELDEAKMAMRSVMRMLEGEEG
ncbi:MAG: hypothetical protein ACO22Z_08675 [Paracoccaceae bacterium]